MRRLREEDFSGRFRMADFVGACRQAFELYGRGQITNPARQETVEERDGLDYFRLDMPAQWPGHYRARKIIEEYSDVNEGRLAKREAYIALEDLRTGDEVRLDAGYITDMRTGAAGALGVEYLSPRPVRRVAILGTGRIAHSLAQACDNVFELDEVRCTSRREANRSAFAERVAPDLEASLTMTDSLAACLEGADAVLTAVPTPRPILGESDLAAIDTVAVMAGDSRTRQVELEVLAARPVVVDVLDQAEQSGEFRHAREQGELGRIALARGIDGLPLNIGDAACGRVERTGGVAYLTGMAAQDLCAAAVIYERS